MRAFWERFKQTFHNSEVIVFARLQVLAGAFLAAVTFVLPVVLNIDWSPLIQDPRLLVFWMLFSGLLTEFLRRLRADFSPDNPDDDPPNVAG